MLHSKTVSIATENMGAFRFIRPAIYGGSAFTREILKSIFIVTAFDGTKCIVATDGKRMHISVAPKNVVLDDGRYTPRFFDKSIRVEDEDGEGYIDEDASTLDLLFDGPINKCFLDGVLSNVNTWREIVAQDFKNNMFYIDTDSMESPCAEFYWKFSNIGGQFKYFGSRDSNLVKTINGRFINDITPVGTMFVFEIHEKIACGAWIFANESHVAIIMPCSAFPRKWENRKFSER